VSLQLILGQAVEYSRIRIAPGISTFEATTTAKLQKLQPIKEAFARSQGKCSSTAPFGPPSWSSTPSKGFQDNPDKLIIRTSTVLNKLSTVFEMPR